MKFVCNNLLKYSDVILVSIIFLVFLFVRFYRYEEVLNFSTDQGQFSSHVLEMWRTKKPSLIGPTFSININGRYAFQGPAIYYLHLLFLLIGRWDAVKSSAAFVILSGLMIFPLFQGTVWLLNKKAAYLLVCIYSFVPLYINYTQFLWNPNYQLALLPLLVWSMGKFQVKKQERWFFVVSILSGILLQFHYQFLIIIMGLFGYYFLFRRLAFKYFGWFILGHIIGFSPLLFFEFRHQFYNTQTVWLFLQTILQRHSTNSTGVSFHPHYVLTISFMCCLLVAGLISIKLSKDIVRILCIAILFWGVIFTFTKPIAAFGMAADWNVIKEESVANIIKEQRISGSNVINLVYDTSASASKYLLEKENVELSKDYVSNQYLFVIGTEEDVKKTQAYEYTSFSPHELVNSWLIENSVYQVFLFKRKISSSPEIH